VSKCIVIKGAEENNLRNISLTIPRREFVVITGVSGSGKSSLAFNTLYAEGQRRYIDSLSLYARQFLEKVKKPLVESIEGLPPSLAISQRWYGLTSRSTVGTVTECYDFLRLLFVKTGTFYCINCNIPLEPGNDETIINYVVNTIKEGKRFLLLAPLVKERKGEFKKLISHLIKEGFTTIKVNGKLVELENVKLSRYQIYTIELVVDKLKMKKEMEKRLKTSLQIALEKSGGEVKIEEEDGGVYVFSTRLTCPRCFWATEELTTRDFSFNSPYGACPRCNGTGKIEAVLLDEILDINLSLSQGAVLPWNVKRLKNDVLLREKLKAVAQKLGFTIDTPLNELSQTQLKELLWSNLKVQFSYKVTPHKEVKIDLEFKGIHEEASPDVPDYAKSQTVCPLCKGARLTSKALLVKVAGKNIAHFTTLSIASLYDELNNISFPYPKNIIATPLLTEIKRRLNYLLKLGLGYITLDREITSLSGGELQRVRLATQLGSGLKGVLYVMDEPTLGLHPKDTQQLLEVIQELKELGNTLVVVEHDEQVIRRADYIVDLGPGAGSEGGRVVLALPLKKALQDTTESVTIRYLKGKLDNILNIKERLKSTKFLYIKEARAFNLKKINVKLPLGVMVCITGVSGAGKSSLVQEVIYKNLSLFLSKRLHHFYNCKEIQGIENIKGVILLDQSPPGKNPRSTPATYTGIFTEIRSLFASTPQARRRGYGKEHFSFNLKMGRCPQCDGLGEIKITGPLLPDVEIKCDLCKGKRFKPEILDITFKGKNIFQILQMTIKEAVDFFALYPDIAHKLNLLVEIGLSYLSLGQSSYLLSGGEAQRVKLASELGKRSTGGKLYILDEPSLGLHFVDLHLLIKVLRKLVEKGNSVVVVEHNLDIIKTADYVIDLGPEGGEAGGYVVAYGTPEEIAKNPASYTGKALRERFKTRNSL